MLTTALDGAIGNSLAAIFDALINHFLDAGLSGLASVVSPGSSVDNWSYQGQTLNSGSVSYGVDGSVTAGVFDINIPKQSVVISVNPPIAVGSTTLSTIYDTSRTISGGTPPYSVITSIINPISSRVVTAEVVRSASSSVLKLHGKEEYRCTDIITVCDDTITIKDSSNPPKMVTLNINVYEPGALLSIPRKIDINVNDTASAVIIGGTPPYKIPDADLTNSNTKPDPTIALAELSDSNLIVTGAGNGVTQVVIEDSVKKRITLDIKVTAPTALVLGAKNVGVLQNDTTDVEISGGTPPYMIETMVDPGIATAEIFHNSPPNNPPPVCSIPEKKLQLSCEIAGGAWIKTEFSIKIKGVKGGDTAAIVRDSSNPFKLESLNIKTIPIASSQVIGTCTVRDQVIATTEESCITSKGVWQCNYIPGTTTCNTTSATTSSSFNIGPKVNCVWDIGDNSFNSYKLDEKQCLAADGRKDGMAPIN